MEWIPMKKLSILLVVVCTGLTVAQAPPNDTCQTAILLPGIGIHAGTTIGAGASIFGTGTCGLPGSDVFYRYTAIGTGNKLIASTCPPGSSTFSSGVDIFTGICLGPPVTAGCNVAWCDNGSGIIGGRAVATTTAGVSYLIRVKNTTGGTGTFNLYVDEIPVPAPSNGTCGAPAPVVDGLNAGMSNFGEPTGLAAGFSPMCAPAGRDVFFVYVATGTGSTTVQTCFAAPTPVPALNMRDSVLSVYQNCSGGTALVCNDNGGCGFVAGQGSNLSSVTFPSTVGLSYVIQVAGVGSGAAAQEGIFDITITPPPPNDECAGALAVTTGTNPTPGTSGVYYSMNSATTSAGWPNPPLCVGVTLGADVWFAFTPAVAGIYQIDTETPAGFTAGSLDDTTLEVFPNTGCVPGAAIACDDDSGVTGIGLLSVVIANLAAGSTYYIRVGDWGSFNGGTFYLNLTFQGPPLTNDECATPLAIGPGSNGPYSNVLATDSPFVGTACGSGNKDLWFSYTPTCGGPTTITTGCGGFDTLMSVYTSCGGTEIACNDDDPTGNCWPSSVLTNLNLTAGTTYIIRVASPYFGISGSFNVDITPGLGLNWSSPLGPGTAQFSICNGPPNGTYYLFATLFQGGFPNGWFYGLDITLQEISSQIGFGFPFNGPLDGAGAFASPLFGGVPSGLTVYSIAFGVPPAATSPSANSGAKSYTIP
jgi:hypothetical protein